MAELFGDQGVSSIVAFRPSKTDDGGGGLENGLSAMPRSGSTHNPPAWSPENPIFIVGALLAVTFGLIFVSTTVKAGPAKASLTL